MRKQVRNAFKAYTAGKLQTGFSGRITVFTAASNLLFDAFAAGYAAGRKSAPATAKKAKRALRIFDRKHSHSKNEDIL